MITDDQCRQIIEAYEKFLKPGPKLNDPLYADRYYTGLARMHSGSLAEEVLRLRLQVWDLEAELHGPTYEELKAEGGILGPATNRPVNIEIMGHPIEWWKALEAENERLRADNEKMRGLLAGWVAVTGAEQELADSIADQAEPEICIALAPSKSLSFVGTSFEWHRKPVEEVK